MRLANEVSIISNLVLTRSPPPSATSTTTPVASCLIDWPSTVVGTICILVETRVAGAIETSSVEIKRVEAKGVEAKEVEAERVEAKEVEAERVEAERVEAEGVGTKGVGAIASENKGWEGGKADFKREEGKAGSIGAKHIPRYI
jgi:hypothetical protein